MASASLSLEFLIQRSHGYVYKIKRLQEFHILKNMLLQKSSNKF